MTEGPAPRAPDRPLRAAAILVAAGSGTRAGGAPKQWRPLAGARVVDHAARALAAAGLSPIVTVTPAGEEGAAPAGTLGVPGGATRADSVRAGLAALAEHAPSHVLIHDGARPCIDQATIARVLDALRDHDAAAPALPVTDALWRGAAAVEGTVDRAGLLRAQTPQGFAYPAILAALEGAGDVPDDVTAARAAGIEVAVVAGSEDNLKITAPEDFARAERLLSPPLTDLRTGHGYDVHRFGPGTSVTLCGVEVPHDRGLVGHSDADVGLHVIADALYGATATGDIGRHFPPSDPQWKGAASHVFAAHAARTAREAGWRIANVDVTLICEQPKIGPHAAAMTARVAAILDLSPDRVSIKATTTERLGFTGRAEGIAASATATVIR
ncbi:MAG: bifunctional 2-C-methyl-D-erythritol 4-phosphate cytidylyltransferase/2-C-methyl-D-erythritol 2,4-cyclodiphosphate synthase [Paracoccaceae bacterium]